MTYKEEIKDLFSVPDDYYLAHCISADFGMGKGIVIEFNKRFNMKHKLQVKYPDFVNKFHRTKCNGVCILEGKVFNLVTKERYYQKPTYQSIKNALWSMSQACKDIGITKVAMPTIGCGLDGLQWNKVSEIIKATFRDTDVEILICRQ